MKLFKMWSDLPESGAGVNEKIRWWRNRCSSLVLDDQMVQGFSTLEKWEREVLTKALGRFFTEGEVYTFKLYYQNITPGKELHVEELDYPLEASYLHRSEIEYSRQTGWLVPGEPPSGQLSSLDVCGSVMNETEHTPSSWEAPENWVRRKPGWNTTVPDMTTIESEYRRSHPESCADPAFEDIARNWPNLRTGERVHLITRYKVNRLLGDEDARVIGFLIEHTTPGESGALPSMIIRLTDKTLALKLLLESLERIRLEVIGKGEASGENHYQAMVYLHDPDAIGPLKTRLSAMLESTGLYEKGDYFYPGIFINRMAMDFVSALTALCTLEPKDDNLKLLEGFTLHPNAVVAQVARARWRCISEHEQPGG